MIERTIGATEINATGTVLTIEGFESETHQSMAKEAAVLANDQGFQVEVASHREAVSSGDIAKIVEASERIEDFEVSNYPKLDAGQRIAAYVAVACSHQEQ